MKFIIVVILLISLSLIQIEAARKGKRGNDDDGVESVSMDKLDEKLKELKKKNSIESDELSAVERSKLENEYQKLKNDVNKISKTKGSLINIIFQSYFLFAIYITRGKFNRKIRETS